MIVVCLQSLTAVATSHICMLSTIYQHSAALLCSACNVTGQLLLQRDQGLLPELPLLLCWLES